MSCSYPDLGSWGGKKPEPAEDAAITLAEELAWGEMLRLTAGRVSVCPVTVRPVVAWDAWPTWVTAPAGFELATNSVSLARLPVNAAVELGVLNLGGGADSLYHRQIPLEAPVGKIVSVVIDGSALDRSCYRVDEGYLLVRTDGQPWPTGQRLDVPAGGPGTFEVTYYPGLTPGGRFKWATGQLAAEFYAALVGKNCRLPKGTTSVVRQGVTIDRSDPLLNGRTGIREIDQVIALYNPHELRQRPVIASPDTIRRRPRRVG